MTQEQIDGRDAQAAFERRQRALETQAREEEERQARSARAAQAASEAQAREEEERQARAARAQAASDAQAREQQQRDQQAQDRSMLWFLGAFAGIVLLNLLIWVALTFRRPIARNLDENTAGPADDGRKTGAFLTGADTAPAPQGTDQPPSQPPMQQQDAQASHIAGRTETTVSDPSTNTPAKNELDARLLGVYLHRIGSVGLVGCLIWWFVFYANVAKQMGGNPFDLGEVTKCLFVTDGPCIIIKAFASAAGYWAYDPIFLWLSAIVFGAGLLMSKASR